MVADRLVELIETNRARMSADVATDLATNARTRGFRAVPRQDLEARVFQILQHLSQSLGDQRSERVKAEFADWGRRRFDQGIPFSEIIYSIIVLKHHLSRYIRENGLVETSFPRVGRNLTLPVHLNSLQELNVQMNLFFDEALYHLSRGYHQQPPDAPGVTTPLARRQVE